jgi:hypothetical protein
MTNLFHTDSVLRKHQLLVRQEIRSGGDRFVLVDWETREPVSKSREEKYWADEGV